MPRMYMDDSFNKEGSAEFEKRMKKEKNELEIRLMKKFVNQEGIKILWEDFLEINKKDLYA